MSSGQADANKFGGIKRKQVCARIHSPATHSYFGCIESSAMDDAADSEKVNILGSFFLFFCGSLGRRFQLSVVWPCTLVVRRGKIGKGIVCLDAGILTERSQNCVPDSSSFHPPCLQHAFQPKAVQEKVREVIEATLKGKEYNEAMVPQWINDICESCVEELFQPRKPFKYVVTCAIMQRTGAAIHSSTACYWDARSDGASFGSAFLLPSSLFPFLLPHFLRSHSSLFAVARPTRHSLVPLLFSSQIQFLSAGQSGTAETRPIGRSSASSPFSL